jgi:hypothetical protein
MPRRTCKKVKNSPRPCSTNRAPRDTQGQSPSPGAERRAELVPFLDNSRSIVTEVSYSGPVTSRCHRRVFQDNCVSSIPTRAESNNKQQTTDHRQYDTTKMGYSADDRLPFGPSQDRYKEQLSPIKMALAMAKILSFHHQPGRIDRRSLPSDSYTCSTPSFPT